MSTADHGAARTDALMDVEEKLVELVTWLACRSRTAVSNHSCDEEVRFPESAQLLELALSS
jgi:hypothetical protein